MKKERNQLIQDIFGVSVTKNVSWIGKIWWEIEKKMSSMSRFFTLSSYKQSARTH